MGTQKGLCPHCQNKTFERRIFQVNPEASTCFCPVCMQGVDPKVAIAGYRKHIDAMLALADNTLFVTCDPTLAYQQYADVLELEPSEAHALLGRILCLVYMCKVRKSFLPEASILLENTSTESVNLDDFVFFLKKINFALDEYDEALRKRLSFKEHFYDLDCLKLYWARLYEIIKMKEKIRSLMSDIKKIHPSHQNEVLINILDHNIDEKNAILHLETFVVDGHSYIYERFHNSGSVLVSSGKKEEENKFTRYRLSSLNKDEKGKRYIKDEIFKDYTKVVAMKKASLVLAIIFFLFAGGFGAAAALFKDDFIFFVSFVSAGGVLFIGAILFFVLHLCWRAVLKKRKLRII